MRTRQLAVAAGATVFLVLVVSQSWVAGSLGLNAFLAATISGIATGSIFAVAASGLVVTYTTSGIFNFAQGAMGMLMAFLYWELRVNRHLPAPLALLLVLGLAAPLFGAVVERTIMRRLQDAAIVNQLVVTIGLMLALMGVVAIIWPPNTASRSLTPFFGSRGFHAPGDVVVTWHRLIAICVAVLVAVFLRLLLFRTRIGIAMRAVVDNRELAGLNGARAARASMTAWALGSVMAALAGILLAPEITLSVEPLTLLIIDAFAAAILGRLRNLPLTYVGGLVLGLLNAYALTFLDLNDRWSGTRTAIPTIFLFFVLLALPEARIQLGRLARPRAARVPKVWESAVGMTVLVAGMALLAAVLSPVNVNRMTLAMTTALVMLSLVPLTGWAGQISLAQMTFAGVGAFAMFKVAGDSGSILGVLAAGALAVPVGLVMSIPALRLQGLYLALASMAFARLAELVIFPQPGVFESNLGGAVRFNPLNVFGWHVTSARAYLVVVTAVFGLLGTGLVALRRSGYGRRLVAMRDSPAACATLGVDLLVAKLSVFALSAALAGVAGALFAVYRVNVGTSDFSMLASLPVILLLVVGGVTTVSGALFGGLFTVFLVILRDTWDLSIFSTLLVLGPGLAAVGIGRSPTGAVVEIAEALAPVVPWRRDARARLAAARVVRRRDEPGELGLTRPFTAAAVRDLDDFLGLHDGATVGTPAG